MEIELQQRYRDIQKIFKSRLTRNIYLKEELKFTKIFSITRIYRWPNKVSSQWIFDEWRIVGKSINPWKDWRSMSNQLITQSAETMDVENSRSHIGEFVTLRVDHTQSFPGRLE